jgi:hypothetical protein
MRIIDIIAAVSATATLVIAVIIYSKIKILIMNDQEILAALEEADQATNDIAADIQILIDNKQVSPEVAEKLTAHVTKLKGIASER